jgi:transposase
MLRLEEWMDLHVLTKQGLSQREIARQTGYSRNTVKKLLAVGAGGIQERQYTPRASKLDPYKAYVHDRYCQTGLSAVRLAEELAAQGYTGGVDVIRR